MNNFDDLLIKNLDYIKDSTIKEAMLYALISRAKRIRPKLLYSIVDGFGVFVKDIDKIACAIELIHTYSLVHDDLPAMDDDTLRRGRKTVHIEYDEASAILAGDALLTEAFNLVSKADIDSNKLIKIIHILSEYSGANGMIYGQYLDLKSEGKNIDLNVLKEIYAHKTSLLLTAPLCIGTILSNKESLFDKFYNIGYLLGLYFQFQDDILDYTSSSLELGKSNSDLDNDKATIIKILGLNEAKTLLNDINNEIIENIKGIDGFNDIYLLEIIKNLKERKS